MAIKKRKFRKAFFYIILKPLKAKQNKIQTKKSLCYKYLFQERENKGAFHQTLQNIRVSDLHAQIEKLISGT